MHVAVQIVSSISKANSTECHFLNKMCFRKNLYFKSQNIPKNFPQFSKYQRKIFQQDRTLHFCALFDQLLSLVLIYFLSASLSQTAQQMAESLLTQFSKTKKLEQLKLIFVKSLSKIILKQGLPLNQSMHIQKKISVQFSLME